MKIGLVTSHYPPDLAGATEYVAHVQASELTARGHEVRVVAGCSWPHAGRDVLRGRIDDSSVSYLPNHADERSPSGQALPRWTRLALEELRGVDACLVHSSLGVPPDLIQSLARRMPVIACRSERITSPQSESDDTEPAGGLNCGDSAGTRLLERDLDQADRVLAASTEIERSLRVAIPSLGARLAVLPHGLCREMPPMHKAQRRAPWDGERPISLFHFGQRTTRSGLQDLLDGLRSLPVGRFELVLAGGEGEHGVDDRLTARAEGMPVHFFGPYKTSQLAALASACDLAVFPAQSTCAHGQVIDEALALGLPVWCSEQADPHGRIRPICEPVNRAGRSTLERVESRPGRILPAQSPAAWTRAFEQLLEDPEQLHVERHAIPGSFETTRGAVDRLESMFEELLSQAVRKAS